MNVGNPALPAALDEPLVCIVRGTHCLEAAPTLILPSHAQDPFPSELCCAVLSHSVVSDSATPWTVACQAPLSMGFSKQEYWSGLPCPPQGIFPTSGLNPGLWHCRWILYQLSYREAPPSELLLWLLSRFSRV